MKPPKESHYDVTETTIRKTADLGAKIALSFIPGASTAYELAKLGVTQAQAYVEQKQNQRIVDFHAMLIKQDEHWNQDMADACIEAADYHLLLSACVQDLEDEKTELYAALAKNAALRRITPQDIRFFTLSLRELSLNDVKEMQVAYIASKYPLIPPSGAGNYKKDLSLERASDHQVYGRKLMEQRGFVKDEILSGYGERFIAACHLPDQLIPGAIGMKEWKNPNSPLLLLCYEIGDTYITTFSERLSQNLRTQGYATTGLAAITREKAIPFIRYSLLIFKDKPESIVEHIRFIEKTLKKGSIALQLSKSFPAVLEPVRHLFAHVLPVEDPDPRHAADIVAQLITSDETTGELVAGQTT